MHKKILLYIIIGLSVFSESMAQKPYLQVQTSGGYSKPLLDFKDPFHFAGDGWNANVSFGMFFGKFGIMARGGYQRFTSSPSFQSFVFEKYKENLSTSSDQNWVNAYAMIGPVFKFTFGRVDVDLFAQIGMTNLTVPSLEFFRKFVGQNAEIATYYGKNDELIPLWTGGMTVHYRLTKSLYLFLEPSFLTNKYLSETYTTFRYVNVKDINMNGYIDDSEYAEAEVVKNIRNMSFSSLNFNVGISYQLGRRKATIDPIPMISLEENTTEENNNPEKNDIDDTQNPDVGLLETTPSTEPEVIQNNENISSVIGTDAQKSPDIVSQNAQKFDEAEARFLYRAGEMYFQANDFENALACFNKLKNDSNHIMAKYMFALALTEMQNCEEAKKEFEEFEQKYQKDDVGVLTTVFISHYEKCKKDDEGDQVLIEKLRTQTTIGASQKEGDPVQIQTENNAQVKSPDTNRQENNQKPSSANDIKDIKGMEYKIQFVALKISNKSFPRLENIGDITHEYFPKKSMYRYTLGPYATEDEAVSDMLKVRAMGFEDAFLAVYKNGVRSNTLYHSRLN